MGSRTPLALLCTGLTAWGFAGCGGSASSGSQQPTGSAQPTASTPPVVSTQTAPPDQTAQPVRLGCHEYCQQAGGYGAGGAEKPPLATVATRGTVTPVDGLVPIEVKCHFRAPCQGALLLNAQQNGGSGDELGRSDLVVPPNSTLTLGVPLSPAGQRALGRGGELPVDATADTFTTLNAIPVAERADWTGLEVATIRLAAG